MHNHREYVPLEVHHVWPLGEGGPDEKWNLIVLCCNAHTAVHEYLRALKRHNGEPPHEFKRLYGERVREVAIVGWNRMNGREDEVSF